MATLIVVRHGESVWNLENRFTGWVDVPLSAKGMQEAVHAGILLKNHRFDAVFTSHLYRSIETMQLMFRQSADQRTVISYDEDDASFESRQNHSGNPEQELPVFQTKALAERYYGQLQGLNKKETAEKYGADQVFKWRRSFDIRPPGGDSLKDTIERVMPYFEAKIKPLLLQGKNVLIVAHGNSIRAIVKYLEKLSDDQIPLVEMGLGVPVEYTLDGQLNVLSKKELQ